VTDAPEHLETPVDTLDMPAPPPVKADEHFALNPMERRFLFVDVAAQRAKQLRKGALNRLKLAAEAGDLSIREVGQKPERVAMEELRRGFVQYSLPDGSPLTTDQEA
jgi:DNA-directed RNA polymerase subunit K/omega